MILMGHKILMIRNMRVIIQLILNRRSMIILVICRREAFRINGEASLGGIMVIWHRFQYLLMDL
jgi:hypothetical protein